MARPEPPAPSGPAVVLRRLAPFAEAAFVAIVAYWMLTVRLIPLDKFATPDAVYFIGTDPYYHLRAVLVSVASFPDLLRYDPWTQFPAGTETGQFGTLFDLLIAAAVLLTGDGSDRLHVARVVAAAPAVYGALIAVPVYLIGRRLGGRIAAVWSVVVLALLPGEFLIRSLASYADHHVGEALFSAAAILGVLWAATAGRRLGTGGPRWKALAPAAAGAFGLFLYIWTWPPGVFFVAILGTWVVAQILLDHFTGTDGDTLRGFAWAMGLAFGGAAVLTLALVEHASFAFNLFSLIQPASLALVGLAAVGLEYAIREGRARELHRAVVPAGGVAAGVLGLVLLIFLAPEVYGMLRWGFSWVTGIGTTANILTIQEARSSCDARAGESFPFCATLARSYSFTLFVALAAVPILAWETGRRRRPGDLLLLVWLLVLLVAATNQVRFNYYLAIPIALANGWLVAWVARVTGFTSAVAALGTPPDAAAAKCGGAGRRARAATRGPEFAWYQPLAIGAVCLLVLPGLVEGNAKTLPADDLARLFDPDHEVVLWHNGLDWMRVNTPGLGMDLTRAHDVGFEYPANAYGVLAWWDYGHWIQVLGERPPVANPFQQNAPFASLWFTERDPTAAEARFATLAGDPYRVRYIAISEADALGKYGAITVWANQQNESRHVFGRGDTIVLESRQLGAATHQVDVLGPAYTETMMYRLFFENGDGLAHYRLVYQYPGSSCVGNAVDANGQRLAFHTTLNPGRLCRGTPVVRPETTPAQPAGSAYWLYDYLDLASLKFFEHVRGARLVGTAPPGSTVEASVVLLLPFGGTTAPFTYRQTAVADAAGDWTMTVPYSTTDPVPVAEGGTTLQVQAAGGYTVAVQGRPTQPDVHVPDRAVLEGLAVQVPQPQP